MKYDFGKEVNKLAETWHKENYPNANFHKENYLKERQEAYERLCDAYRKLGQPVPPPTVLSGRM